MFAASFLHPNAGDSRVIHGWFGCYSGIIRGLFNWCRRKNSGRNGTSCTLHDRRIGIVPISTAKVQKILDICKFL